MESLNSEQVEKLLKELNQDHILKKFETASKDEKEEFEKQINHLEKVYPGGIREYIKRAKVLLDNSKNNINPYNDYTPSVPEGFNVKVGDENFFSLEKEGSEELKDACFVLVAGGLGERLGYSDIKIGIETDLITKRKFIQIYADYLLAYEDRIRKKHNLPNDWFIPLCIMTSGDTHEKTVALLKEHKNFGLREDQIEIVKQEKCPALLDNDCHLALKGDKLLLETKPHGHGDVHTLLYQNGVVERWVKKGKKWLILFQDTNVLIFNVIPSALGVSKKLELCINSICIPRKPGEALGGICKLTNKDGNSITINVEYNQLDPLLKAKYNPQGDVANKEGLSDFPGNSNVLLFRLDQYFETLKKTKGLMPEFVNPKYADATKTTFKSPTRLECMMQEFPKLLTNNEKVGFSMYDKWFCFSTCKNNLKDGCDKLKKNLQPETAFSLEQDMFKFNIKCLSDILGKFTIEQTEPETDLEIEGQHVKFGPRLIIDPSFAPTLSELKEKIKNKITMTTNSTLILKNNITIEKDIYVDGVLVVDKDVKEEIKCVNKKKDTYVLLKQGEGLPYEQIRGYTMKEQ